MLLCVLQSRMTDWGSYWNLSWNLHLKGWRTNCRLKNADSGRFLAQSHDGLGIILKFVLEFAIEDWSTNSQLKNADYGRVLALSNDWLGIILKTHWKWVFLMIPNPRPRNGHVMLNRCCFASVTLRSKVANFSSSTLPQALNIGGAPLALAHSLFYHCVQFGPNKTRILQCYGYRDASVTPIY